MQFFKQNVICHLYFQIEVTFICLFFSLFSSLNMFYAYALGNKQLFHSFLSPRSIKAFRC